MTIEFNKYRESNPFGDRIDLSEQASVTAGRILGRRTVSGDGAPEAMTGAQAITELPTVASGTAGVVAAPSNTNLANGHVLSASGTWISAPGGSTSPGGATSQIQINNAGSFFGDVAFTYNHLTNTVSNNPSGTQNESFGANALDAITAAASNNAAVGYNALTTNVTGGQNSALGSQSLSSNTASDNTAVGFNALLTNSSAGNNTAVGSRSLQSNDTGANNTAIGYNSLFANTASFNTAVGAACLDANTTGTDNVGVGHNCLAENTTGSSNVSVGKNSLPGVTTGNKNVSIGAESGDSLVSSSGNVFIGYKAGTGETGSDKLHIDGSNNSTPLLGGDFSIRELAFNGAQIVKRVAVSGFYTVLQSDYLIAYTFPSGTCTLPSPLLTKVGKVFIVKDELGNSATNPVTIQSASGNIDGVSSKVLNTNYGSFTLYNAGNGYGVI